MEIAGIEIGHGHPCRTVAELSNNHNGKLENAIRLLNCAKAAGADFAKMQAYTPDELVALRGDGLAPSQWGEQGWTMRDLYTKAMTPREWFPELFAHAKRIGLPLFASVFGGGSLMLMEDMGCPAYKIASLDRDARLLAAGVRATGKPVLVSIPDWDPDTTAQYTADMFLYCPPGYPQPRMELRAFLYNSRRGFSYHGTDPLLPVYAAVNGAVLLECHMQLSDEPSELEANISLTEIQFATMVHEIRKVEALAA